MVFEEVETIGDTVIEANEDHEIDKVTKLFNKLTDVKDDFDKNELEEILEEKKLCNIEVELSDVSREIPDRTELLKTCQICCCQALCVITDHSRHSIPVVVDGISYMQDHLYAGLLYRSWLNLEQYKEMSHIAREDDTLISLLCAVHTYLKEVKMDE